MKIYILIIFIFFYSNSLFAKSLFDSEFYEIKFVSDNVEDTKIKKIKDIKYESINKIFKRILTNDDYRLLKKNLNENLINTFIKNVIFEDEKIINNNYFSNIKINYNKKKIITYLRVNKINYVEFIPDNFLTIIYNKSFFEKTLFSKHNDFYNYLLSVNLNFYQLPNLDLNDRYILHHSDIEKKNINKIKKFAKKYNNSEIIIVIAEKIKKNINYNFYLFTNNKLYPIKHFSQHEIDFYELFTYLKDEVINIWKINNSIQNEFTNSLNCSIKYFNLLELKEILKNMNNILIIDKKKLVNLSYKEKIYHISFFGNLKILSRLFQNNNLKIINKNNICKISLL